MSCITRHYSLSSSAGKSGTRTAPSATSRAHSASSAARRASATRPVPTRTSRCSRFLTTLPSGSALKSQFAAPHRKGRCTQNQRPILRRKCAFVTLPGGETFRWWRHNVPQHVAGSKDNTLGSAQSKVISICLTDAIGPNLNTAGDPSSQATTALLCVRTLWLIEWRRIARPPRG